MPPATEGSVHDRCTRGEIELVEAFVEENGAVFEVSHYESRLPPACTGIGENLFPGGEVLGALGHP